MSKKISTVQLPDQERALLHRYVTTGLHAARSIRRAHMLLAADRHRSDPWIAEHPGVSRATGYHLRRRYCTEGLQAALRDQPRPGAPTPLDGRGEARFTALACSEPPSGRQRWTVRLLADKLVELDVVESISPATVGSLLKKRPQALAQAPRVYPPDQPPVPDAHGRSA